MASFARLSLIGITFAAVQMSEVDEVGSRLRLLKWRVLTDVKHLSLPPLDLVDEFSSCRSLRSSRSEPE
jgi:hypothetical protein